MLKTSKSDIDGFSVVIHMTIVKRMTSRKFFLIPQLHKYTTVQMHWMFLSQVCWPHADRTPCHRWKFGSFQPSLTQSGTDLPSMLFSFPHHLQRTFILRFRTFLGRLYSQLVTVLWFKIVMLLPTPHTATTLFTSYPEDWELCSSPRRKDVRRQLRHRIVSPNTFKQTIQSPVRLVLAMWKKRRCMLPNLWLRVGKKQMMRN